jgi:pyruvate/2-oxoglutarate dehydrogenase complex dihydrolipoamide dehydrogenase (E3) component
MGRHGPKSRAGLSIVKTGHSIAAEELRAVVTLLVNSLSRVDRILGFTAFGARAGEIVSAVQVAMIAGLPYTALRDAVLTHPMLLEGRIPLFSSSGSRTLLE